MKNVLCSLRIFFFIFAAVSTAFSAHIDNDPQARRTGIITRDDLVQLPLDACTSNGCLNEALTLFDWLSSQAPKPDSEMLASLSSMGVLAYARQTNKPTCLINTLHKTELNLNDVHGYLRRLATNQWNTSPSSFRTGLIFLTPKPSMSDDVEGYYVNFYVYKVRAIKRAFIIDTKRQKIIDAHDFLETYAGSFTKSVLWHSELDNLDDDAPRLEPTQEVLPDYVVDLFAFIAPAFDRSVFLESYRREPLIGKNEEILKDIASLSTLRAQKSESEEQCVLYENSLNQLCWRALFDLRRLYRHDDAERAFTYLTMLKFFFAYHVMPAAWQGRETELLNRFRNSLRRIIADHEDLSAKITKWFYLTEGQLSTYLATQDAPNRNHHLREAHNFFMQAIVSHTTKTSHLFLAKLLLVDGYLPQDLSPEEAKQQAYRHIDDALAATSNAPKKPGEKTSARAKKSLMHKTAQPVYLNAERKFKAINDDYVPVLPQVAQTQTTSPISSPQDEQEPKSHDDESALDQSGFFIPFTDADFENLEESNNSQSDNGEFLNFLNAKDASDNREANRTTRTRGQGALSEKKQRKAVLKTYNRLASERNKGPSALKVAHDVATLGIPYRFVLDTLKSEELVKGHTKHVPNDVAKEIRDAYFGTRREQTPPSPQALAEKYNIKTSQVLHLIKTPMPQRQAARLEKTKIVLAAYDILDDDDKPRAMTIISKQTNISGATVRDILLQAGLYQPRAHATQKHHEENKRKRDNDIDSDEDHLKKRKK